MSRTPSVLAFSGSLRKNSWNSRLVRFAADGARAAGADITVIELRDHRVPLFDQDLEAESGKPAEARELKRLMIEHDGFLIASPEYNSSISGVLKNVIDWVSRPDEDKTRSPFRGKVVGVMSASPGALGGVRGLPHVRAILGNLGCLVLPDQVSIPRIHEAFGDDDRLTEERSAQKVLGLGRAVAETIAKLR
jgi:NAD(P)H-dependent FMN reductase